MAGKTKLVRDDVYEELAAAYQCILINILNDVLKEQGITAQAKRRKICESLAFSLGNFNDQCGFRTNEKKVYPLLCFSETFLNLDTEVGKLGKVFAPSDSFAFHEYATGDIACFFDENKESLGDIQVEIVEEKPDVTE